MSMFQTLGKAWQIPDIRRKIVFTLLMLVVFRLGSNIPVPGIDRQVLQEVFEGQGLFELFNLFSGGAFANFTIFALSITPYITASIIINLLTIAIPYLENLAKEGMEGRKKMTQITRYLTVVLALIQAIGFTLGLFRGAVADDVFSKIVIIIVLTAGTAFLMWLGEQINEYGVGNGISLIIFGGIVCRAPSAVSSAFTSFRAGNVTAVSLILFCLFALAVVVGVVLVQQGQRRIPVQYAKRVVGRKMYGGQSTHLPMKVNMSGVMPIIFAQSIASLPATIIMFIPENNRGSISKALLNVFNSGSALYILLYFVLIIGFSYFYATIQFNPIEVANNLRKNGGFITGFRPGRPTSDFIKKVLNKITLFGAIYLGLVAALPLAFGTRSAGIALGGTSIIIVVGVALETVKALEAQMLMRHYKGFLE